MLVYMIYMLYISCIIKNKNIMTTLQENKLKKIGKSLLDYYENNGGELVVTMTYGTKYFRQTFMGVRGGMTNQREKVYRNYTKENGLTGFMFEQYN